jgi:hypothetical protein
MISIGLIENAEWRWVFTFSTILLILLLIPFVWAYGVAAPDSVFMGVLVNPIDGASYQAKMYQGYTGNWLFHLPYTPEPHEPVLLFTYYLGLGHLARILGTSTILVFHAMRMIGGMVMFLAIYRFVSDWTDNVTQRRITWTLAVLGTGFGWIALLFGHISPDMLILPEAFPFQAVYANAHFPWAIAGILVVVHILIKHALGGEEHWPELNVDSIALALTTIFLVSTAPFVLLPVGIAYGVLLIGIWRKEKRFPRRELNWGLIVIIFGLPFIAYNIWAISSRNPVFHAWMSQNITPSPPVWDYLIAFGPILLLALVGMRRLLDKFDLSELFLIAWLVTGLLTLYAPLGLQRRFSMALIMPMAVYAGCGLWRVIVPNLFSRRQFLGVVLGILIFLPTTLTAFIAPMLGSRQLIEESSQSYFISLEEDGALKWLEANAPGALVLASPEVGLILPTRGLKVVYGHAYETINPDQRKQAVIDFYTGADCSVVEDEGVEYIFVGPRERALSDDGICPVQGDPLFRSTYGGVEIYAAGAE